MKIRYKLTYQFISIVAIILALFSVAIYYFSSNFRRDDFYERLKNKSSNVANILIDVDEIDVALLKKIEKDNPASLPKEKIVIYDFNNDLIYDSDEQTQFTINTDLLNEIRINKEIQYKENDYEVVGYLFTSKYDRFVVIAGAQDIYGLKKLKNLRTIIGLVFCSSILLVFAAGSIYSFRALMPISNIIRQVNNIGMHSLNLRLDEGNGKDEISQLAATFNSMLKRVEATVKVQKDFISNASHELRNPLTAITVQLEVLVMNNRKTEEYKQTIYSVLEDMHNLNLISNRLLLLAQASSESSEAGFKKVRIDDLLWQSRSELIKRDKNYIIHIVFEADLDEKHLTVMGNELLLKSAITNLMDNACKYSSDKRVDVSIAYQNASIVLKFTDYGIGIPPEDMDNIYEPFHRGKNVGDIKGHGIGLSLVEKIIRLHQGKISIRSGLQKGTIVSISFPSI